MSTSVWATFTATKLAAHHTPRLATKPLCTASPHLMLVIHITVTNMIFPWSAEGSAATTFGTILLIVVLMLSLAGTKSNASTPPITPDNHDGLVTMIGRDLHITSPLNGTVYINGVDVLLEQRKTLEAYSSTLGMIARLASVFQGRQPLQVSNSSVAASSCSVSVSENLIATTASTDACWVRVNATLLPMAVTGLRLDIPVGSNGNVGWQGNGNFLLNILSATIDGADVSFDLLRAEASFEQHRPGTPAQPIKAALNASDPYGWAVFPKVNQEHWADMPFSTPCRGSTIQVSLLFGGGSHQPQKLKLAVNYASDW